MEHLLVDCQTAKVTRTTLTTDEQTARQTAGGAVVAADTATLGNLATLQQQAQQALVTNRTYIARTSPTAAQQTAQVKALTQQHNGVIRLLLGLLDGTD